MTGRVVVDPFLMQALEAGKRLDKRVEVLKKIADELDHAYAKHGGLQWGRHEFYGILTEEYRELEKAIFEDEPIERVIAELVQVAAMCVRYYETGDRYGWVAKKGKA
jgi:hypothetical protein